MSLFEQHSLKLELALQKRTKKKLIRMNPCSFFEHCLTLMMSNEVLKYSPELSLASLIIRSGPEMPQLELLPILQKLSNSFVFLSK